MLNRFWPYLLLPLAGALLAYLILPTPPPTYTEMIVPARQIIRLEPASKAIHIKAEF